MLDAEAKKPCRAVDAMRLLSDICDWLADARKEGEGAEGV